MTDPGDDPTSGAQLKRLGDRIDALKKDKAPKPRQDTTNAAGGAELAWRMVIELVAGIVIGFGIGYGLDYLFGTMPILLVLFTLFGFAAGVQTMMRTARAAQEKAGADAPAEDGTGRGPPDGSDSERGAFDEDED